MCYRSLIIIPYSSKPTHAPILVEIVFSQAGDVHKHKLRYTEQQGSSIASLEKWPRTPAPDGLTTLMLHTLQPAGPIDR
jgi:hypothetical protein